MIQRFGILALFVVVTFGAAAIGSAVTLPEIGGWYRALAKPAWTPPDQVFGPVWTALYAGIALSGWLVWRAAGWHRAHWLWALQLALNTAWSVLFFGLHLIGAAAIEILALLAAIAVTARAFHPLSPAAAWLLAPYLAWVGFATALTWTILVMN